MLRGDWPSGRQTVHDLDMESSSRRVLLTVSRLGLELAKGLLRIGVVIAVYVVSAFAGVIIAVMSAQEGVQSLLLAAGAGLLLPAVALTGGLLGWLSLATIRIYARGGNPDLDAAVPRPADAVLLIGIAKSDRRGWSMVAPFLDCRFYGPRPGLDRDHRRGGWSEGRGALGPHRGRNPRVHYWGMTRPTYLDKACVTLPHGISHREATTG